MDRTRVPLIPVPSLRAALLRWPASPAPRWWLWLAIGLTGLKLWLSRGQLLFAIGGAAHDDRLFVDLAGYLIHGQWLGPYNQFTLAKGPFFSLFIAGNFWTGIPLGLTQQIFYALACAAMVFALRPWLRHPFFVFAAYAVLLWNPMSFEGGNLARLMRQNVATPLALLVFAGLVALYSRRRERLIHQGGWAALAGLALGCFWITREESVWLLPGAAMLAVAYGWDSFRHGKSEIARRATVVVLLGSFALLPGFLVSTLNARHYGWFGTVEFRASEFKDAYGALSRVRAGPDVAMVPVTRAMRLAAYEVSPAFAELQPYLEGEIGLKWADQENFPPHEIQIRGGWFMWALRDAVAAAGHARSAAEALNFYQRIADEVNHACDAGSVAAGPPRSGFLPQFDRALLPDLVASAREFAGFFIRFHGFTARTPPSTGDYAELRPFRDFTRERVSPSERSPDPSTPGQDRIIRLKVAMLETLGHAIGSLLGWLVILAHAAAGMRVIHGLATRRGTYPGVVAIAAWLACASYLAINVLVHVTSFHNLTPSAMASAYPLLLVFVIAVFIDATKAWTVQRD